MAPPSLPSFEPELERLSTANRGRTIWGSRGTTTRSAGSAHHRGCRSVFSGRLLDPGINQGSQGQKRKDDQNRTCRPEDRGQAAEKEDREKIDRMTPDAENAGPYQLPGRKSRDGQAAGGTRILDDREGEHEARDRRQKERRGQNVREVESRPEDTVSPGCQGGQGSRQRAPEHQDVAEGQELFSAIVSFPAEC